MKPGGTGGSVTAPSPNSPKLWGAGTVSGRDDRHPLVAGARPRAVRARVDGGDRGTHGPDHAQPRGEGGHQETVKRENLIRAEHKMELRGSLQGPELRRVRPGATRRPRARSSGRATATSASRGATTTTRSTGRRTRSTTASRDVPPVTVEIAGAELHADPPGADVRYVVRNTGEAPVWMVDDGWLAWQAGRAADRARLPAGPDARGGRAVRLLRPAGRGDRAGRGRWSAPSRCAGRSRSTGSGTRTARRCRVPACTRWWSVFGDRRVARNRRRSRRSACRSRRLCSPGSAEAVSEPVPLSV